MVLIAAVSGLCRTEDSVEAVVNCSRGAALYVQRIFCRYAFEFRLCSF